MPASRPVHLDKGCWWKSGSVTYSVTVRSALLTTHAISLAMFLGFMAQMMPL